MNWFKKKELTKDYVDLSVGRIFYKPIVNKMIIEARLVSERRDGGFSNEAYISYLEACVVDLKKRKYLQLSSFDSEVIRAKTIEILKRQNLVLEEEKVEEFTAEEKAWFESRRQKFEGVKK